MGGSHGESCDSEAWLRGLELDASADGVAWQNHGATDFQKALGVRDGLQGTKQWVKVRKCQVSVDFWCRQIVKPLC